MASICALPSTLKNSSNLSFQRSLPKEQSLLGWSALSETSRVFRFTVQLTNSGLVLQERGRLDLLKRVFASESECQRTLKCQPWR